MSANSAFRVPVALEALVSTDAPAAPVSAARAHVAERASCALSHVAVGTPVRITELELDNDLSEWLRAVGICEGECLTVLRRAAFGGPVHVRTHSGGEFALNRSLAHAIAVCALGLEDEEDA